MHVFPVAMKRRTVFGVVLLYGTRWALVSISHLILRNELKIQSVFVINGFEF